MGDKLTWDEIRRKYPDEWVVLVDVDRDESEPDIRSGVVFGHSEDFKELMRRTKEPLKGRGRAVIFTGEVGKGNYLL